MRRTAGWHAGRARGSAGRPDAELGRDRDHRDGVQSSSTQEASRPRCKGRESGRASPYSRHATAPKGAPLQELQPALRGPAPRHILCYESVPHRSLKSPSASAVSSGARAPRRFPNGSALPNGPSPPISSRAEPRRRRRSRPPAESIVQLASLEEETVAQEPTEEQAAPAAERTPESQNHETQPQPD